MTYSKKIVIEDWNLLFNYKNKDYHIPATVPGNVELDLQREGVISNPYPQDDAHSMREFELLDWDYETIFNTPTLNDGEKVDLVFEGIDTVADVFLNDEKIMHTDNMFIPHLVDVTHKLNKDSTNTLKVKIFSPELAARNFEYTPLQSSREHRQQEAYLRKARHMWGWDNAPRLLSAGLWRNVYLAVRPQIRFKDVYIYTNKVYENSASVGIDWTFETPDIDLTSYKGKVIFSSNGKTHLEKNFDVDFTAGSLRRELHLQDPNLWWPSGYGEAHLYDVQLFLYRNNDIVAQWQTKFGVREIELIRTETTDENGSGEFVFKCNGQKIFIRGTNWKPLSPLHSQTPEKMQQALDLCVDLHCNMVRVWGGGIYEDHDFFDYCDENGLLVWQDFMLACGFPPQDESFQKAIETEAVSVIKQLRNHTSLALWCGDNETDQTFFWGMLLPPKIVPSENYITRNVLMRAVRRYDPYRDYLESSPYISDDIAKMRWKDPEIRLKMVPEQHLYLGKQIFLNKCCAHFVSETGSSLMSESPELVEPELARARRLWDKKSNPQAEEFNDGCEAHQLDGYFVNWKHKIRNSVRYQFGKDFPLEPWQDLAMTVNIHGGEYFKCAVEHFRIGKWRRTGMILWSLLDMWPMMFNTCLVDCLFRKKMPYYWVRQSQQPLCLMAEESEAGDMSVSATGTVSVFTANDTMKQYNGQYRILLFESAEKHRELMAGDFSVAPNTTLLTTSMPTPARQALLILEWDIDGKTYYNHFVTGKPPYHFETYQTWCTALNKIYKNETF